MRFPLSAYRRCSQLDKCVQICLLTLLNVLIVRATLPPFLCIGFRGLHLFIYFFLFPASVLKFTLSLERANTPPSLSSTLQASAAPPPQVRVMWQIKQYAQHSVSHFYGLAGVCARGRKGEGEARIRWGGFERCHEGRNRDGELLMSVCVCA